MIELIIGVALLLTGALITLFTYRYRNKIVYELVTIVADTRVTGNKIDLTADTGDTRQLNAVKLTITNRGWRTLQDVSLHLMTRNHPQRIEIGEPTSLSKAAIRWEASDGLLKIDVTTLPSNESFKISYFSLGWLEYGSTELKSAGGQFKIVSKDRYELAQRLWRDLPWFLTLIGMVVLMNLSTWK